MSDRRRIVTEEPLRVHPDLLGRPLASFRRRAAAYLLDLALYGLFALAFGMGVGLWGLERDDPGFVATLRHAAAAPAGASRDSLWDSAYRRFLQVMQRRRPDVFTPAVLDSLDAGARDTTTGRRASLVISGTETGLGHDAAGRPVVFLGTDVLLGGAGVVYKGAALLIAWFTLWTWLGRGRTPGKRLCGLRVAALDGRRLSLWRCFNRAGGYGASAATLGLGFLASRWDPNRQADHDKIVGTVVLRELPAAVASPDGEGHPPVDPASPPVTSA